MGGSPWIVVQDAFPVAGAECGVLQRTFERIYKEAFSLYAFTAPTLNAQLVASIISHYYCFFRIAISSGISHIAIN